MENKIYQNVEIGRGSLLQEFVSIGVPPGGSRDGELRTVIGSSALIRSHSVIYAGNVIGSGFRTGHGSAAIVPGPGNARNGSHPVGSARLRGRRPIETKPGSPLSRVGAFAV